MYMKLFKYNSTSTVSMKAVNHNLKLCIIHSHIASRDGWK